MNLRDDETLEIFLEHRPSMLLWLERFFGLGRRGLAQDVAQEAYIKFRDGYRPEMRDTARQFLMRIARTTAIDCLRKERDELRQPLESVDEAPAEPEEECSHAERARWELKVARAIERLPARYHRIMRMRYLQGMPRREVAKAAGITVKALEQRLTRALRRLRKKP